MAHGALKPLPLNLSLGLSNGCSGIGVHETATILSILELGCLGRAHPSSAGISTAPGATVRIRD